MLNERGFKLFINYSLSSWILKTVPWRRWRERLFRRVRMQHCCPRGRKSRVCVRHGPFLYMRCATCHFEVFMRSNTFDKSSVFMLTQGCCTQACETHHGFFSCSECTLQWPPRSVFHEFSWRFSWSWKSILFRMSSLRCIALSAYQRIVCFANLV